MMRFMFVVLFAFITLGADLENARLKKVNSALQSLVKTLSAAETEVGCRHGYFRDENGNCVHTETQVGDDESAVGADETAVGAYSEYGYELLSDGSCEDYIYLDDKAFPDLLFPSHDLYDKDGIKECLNRCMSNHNSNTNIGTKAFYVKNSLDEASGAIYHQCACSKGTCTSRDATNGKLYTAYSIKKLSPRCASIEGDDSSVCVGKGAFYDPKKKEVRCTSDPCGSADKEHCCTVFAGRYQGWNAPEIDCPGHKTPALTLWMPSGVKINECAALIPSYYFKVTCVNGVHKFAGYPRADCTEDSAFLNIPSDTCHADSNGGSEHWTLGSGFGDCAEAVGSPRFIANELQVAGTVDQFEQTKFIKYCSGSNFNADNIWGLGNQGGSSHCPLCWTFIGYKSCLENALEYCANQGSSCAGFTYDTLPGEGFYNSNSKSYACFRSRIDYFATDQGKSECYRKNGSKVSKDNQIKSMAGMRCANNQRVSAVFNGGKRYDAKISYIVGNEITVNWDDGDTSHRTVKGYNVFQSDGRPCWAEP